MKTTTKTTMLKKIEKLNPNKTSKAYEYVMSAINGSKIIRPCYTNGSGRFITLQDHTLSCKVILNQLGLIYEVGNDAPRGGKTGTFITIKTKITQ